MLHQTILEFGKHRGLPIEAVPTNYLTWLSNERRNIDMALRAAVINELHRRSELRAKVVRQPVAPPAAHAVPTGADRRAVFNLLSDLLAAGVRLVSRGNGAVHIYNPSKLRHDLQTRLSTHLLDLDALVRHVRLEVDGSRRRHAGHEWLAGQLQSGVRVEARPDQKLVGITDAGEEPLVLDESIHSLVWFLLAAGVPETAGSDSR
jgi:hypothetical protein